jgi:hypothetical protein
VELAARTSHGSAVGFGPLLFSVRRPQTNSPALTAACLANQNSIDLVEHDATVRIEQQSANIRPFSA